MLASGLLFASLRHILKTLTLFQTKIYDFPYPISDLTPKCIPYFRPVLTRDSLTIEDKHYADIMLFCLLFISISVRVFWPFLFSFVRPGFSPFAICTVRGEKKSAKIIPYPETKTTKSIPYFRLNMPENDTLWGGT